MLFKGDAHQMKAIVQKISLSPDTSLEWFGKKCQMDGKLIKVKPGDIKHALVVGVNRLPKEGQFYFEVKIHDKAKDQIHIGIMQQQVRKN